MGRGRLQWRKGANSLLQKSVWWAEELRYNREFGAGRSTSNRGMPFGPCKATCSLLCTIHNDVQFCQPQNNCTRRAPLWSLRRMTNQRLMAQYGFVLPGGNPADRLAFATLPAPGEGSESEGSEQESAAAAGGGALLSLDRMQVGSGT